MAFQFIFEKVNFIGESSIDSGGPRREFFRLLAYESSQLYMRGGKDKYMASNVAALQVIQTIVNI